MSDWLTPFFGDGIEWHEGLPSPYTYQESDFGKLVTAVHQYECARDEAQEKLHQCRADYHAKVIALQKQLAASEHVRRQLAEALRQIEFLPYSVTGDVEADWRCGSRLRRTKEIAHVALAASDTLDKEET